VEVGTGRGDVTGIGLRVVGFGLGFGVFGMVGEGFFVGAGLGVVNKIGLGVISLI